MRRNHTDAKVVYEFMPFDVNVNTLDTALELVQGAAEPTARWRSTPGTWASSGSRPADLKRIPPEYLGWVELSDGQVREHGRPDR